MAGWLTPAQRRTISAALDLVVPADGPTPGAGAAGGADYVDGLLGAFDVDPPRIWAGGPYSGRHGGAASFGSFIELGPWEALAWRTRIEGWQETYADGLATLGDDFADLDADMRAARLASTGDAFRGLLFIHACESLYGDPVYGGNRDRSGWRAIGFEGDVQPRGYTDTEVSDPLGERGR